MDISPSRAIEIARDMLWTAGEPVRVLWVSTEGSDRDNFARLLFEGGEADATVGCVLRQQLFKNPNAVQSDLMRLLDSSRTVFEQLPKATTRRVTIFIVARDRLELPQAASPVTLPGWFPCDAGRTVNIRIRDVATEAHVGLLNCPECRSELLGELLLALEASLVSYIRSLQAIDQQRAIGVLSVICGTSLDEASLESSLQGFEQHIRGVAEPRGYRPNSAKDTKSIVSKLLRRFLSSSFDELPKLAKQIADADDRIGKGATIRTTLFGVMFRPVGKMSRSQAAWHAILVAVYQAYQCLNAAAHAGDYEKYPVGLIYANALDLGTVLRDAATHVDSVA